MVRIIGTEGDDALRGTAGADLIDGRGGADNLQGRGANDTLVGGDGIDALFGQEGDDELRGGAGDDTFLGGPGRDLMVGDAGNDAFGGRSQGADRIVGGAGFDIVSYEGEAARGVTIDLAAGTVRAASGTDRLSGVESAVGSNFGDTIRGGGGDESLFGQDGADRIDGGAGDETIAGGLGDDTLRGGAGDDTFVVRAGDAGDDRIEGFVAGAASIDDQLLFTDGIRAEDTTIAQAREGALVSFEAFGEEGSVLLVGVDAAELAAADILFDV